MLILAIATFSLALASANLLAQSEPHPPPAADQPASPLSQERNRDRVERLQRVRDHIELRAMLQRRIERLQRAIDLLDKGEPLDEVRREAGEPFLAGAPGPPGPGAEPGDRDRPEGGPSSPDGRGRFPGPSGPDDRDPDRRPPRGEGVGAGGRFTGPLSDEQKTAVREILAATAPTMLRRLRQLEQQDAAEADKRYAEAYPRVRELMDLKARDPDLYELRLGDMKHGREAMDAARWIVEHERPGATATPEEIKEQNDRLRAAVGAQFDYRRKLQERDAAAMEARAKTIRDEIAAQAEAARERVVERLARGMLDRTRERMSRQPEGEARRGDPLIPEPPGGPGPRQRDRRPDRPRDADAPRDPDPK